MNAIFLQGWMGCGAHCNPFPSSISSLRHYRMVGGDPMYRTISWCASQTPFAQLRHPPMAGNIAPRAYRSAMVAAENIRGPPATPGRRAPLAIVGLALGTTTTARCASAIVELRSIAWTIALHFASSGSASAARSGACLAYTNWKLCYAQ
jgi:hypothetical protein